MHDQIRSPFLLLFFPFFWQNTFQIVQNIIPLAAIYLGFSECERRSAVGVTENASLAAQLCSVLCPVARGFLLLADNAADMKLSAFRWFWLRNACGHPMLVICFKLPVCILAHFISSLEKCISLCKVSIITINTLEVFIRICLKSMF